MASCAQKPLEITRTQLKDKIAGAWLGQMVGNIYGLEYENKFVDEMLGACQEFLIDYS